MRAHESNEQKKKLYINKHKLSCDSLERGFCQIAILSKKTNSLRRSKYILQFHF